MLNPQGYLFLGSAETVGSRGDLFIPVDKQWKIFRRQGGKSQINPLFPFSGPVGKPVDTESSLQSAQTQETAAIALADKLLMERYVPARVIINEKNEVLHFSKQAGAYLLTPEGKPTRDLLKIAKEELRPALRAAIYKTFAHQKENEYRGIKVATDSGAATINIIATPLKPLQPAGKLALVIIEPVVPSVPCLPGEAAGSGDEASRSLASHLEEQLRVTTEQLQSTSEQLETSNERFTLAHEELLTVNEELQSTNEELQSTNEELVTINYELQKKMEELNQSNSDLENLFASSEIATLFIDRKYLVKGFSPAMASLFSLVPADIGRSIRHLNIMSDWTDLLLDAASVLEELVPIEREVHSQKDGRSFIMRVLPYRTTAGLIDGVVVTLIDISERKRAELAVQESEERFRTMANAMPQLAWIARPDGYIFWYNQRWYDYTGTTPEQMEGWGWQSVHDPLALPKVMEQWTRAIATAEPFDMEFPMRGADGTFRWFLTRGLPLKDSQGNIIQWFGTNTDVTEHKQAEATRARLAAIVESSEDAIVAKDLNAIITSWNAGAERLFGYRSEEAVGRPITLLIPPELHDDERRMLQRLLAGERISHFETVRLTKEGRRIDVSLTVSPIKDGEGRIIGISKVARDITESKRVEEEIRQRESRLRRLVEILQHPADSIQGLLDNALEQALQLTESSIGYIYHYHEESRQLVLNSWSKGVLPACAVANPQTCYELDKTGIWGEAVRQRRPLILNDFQADHPLKKGYPEGHVPLLKFVTIPIFRNDRIVSVVGLANKAKDYDQTDILQISLLMDTVWKVADNMRAEKENVKLQAHLIQAQKMEAIGTLAGGIAHDFNNILGAVLGYTEMARDASPVGSVIVHDLDKVMEAGGRAADLVKQILTFSREASLERIPLDPLLLVKETLKLLRPALPSTINIKQQLDTATSPILADPTQVHQIVMNLCTNAFHAMEQTGGILEIILKNREISPPDHLKQAGMEPGNYVLLSISDTGPGIAPAIRDKIFDPYFTTKEAGKGTGMGLSIVHGIVTAMGGFIACQGEFGEGATFEVYFPAMNREIAAVTKPVEAICTGHERILFVDDEAMLAEMGKIMLERLGYQVTLRTSSLEALATFQNQPDQFDAVITDQTMPGLTGIELARRMLRIRPDIPIILSTGYSNLVNEEQIKLIGIKGFIMKPMTKRDIAQLLRGVLKDSELP